MNDYSNPRRKFGSRPQQDGDRPMYDAVCADCGVTCKVPFQPTGEKPVYCSDCYDKHRESESPNGGGSRQSSFRQPHRDSFRPSFTPSESLTKDDLKAIIAPLEQKLDTMISLLNILTDKKVHRVASKTGEGQKTIDIIGE